MKLRSIRGKKLYQEEKVNLGVQSITKNQLLIGIFLLLIGITVGITINLGSTFALESATAADATSANATSTNATASNATDSNATSSNATSSNAQITDNIIYLNSLSLGADGAKVGDKVYVNKSTSGACNTAMSITFMDKTTSNSFSVNVEDINNNPYFIVPNNVVNGTYEIISVFLVGLNSDNTTFTKKIGTSNVENEMDYYNFDTKISIAGNEAKKVELTKLTLQNSSAKIGDKVNLTVQTTDTLTSLKLTFKSNAGKEFISYVSNLGNSPFFTIPSTVKADNYYLYQASLATSKSSNIYTNGSNYNFNLNLEVKDADKVSYVYNNNDINSEVIKNIYNGNDDLEVKINANDNSIISSELFNAIKGTNKKLIISYNDNEIVFCGKDIETTKSIDTSISTNVVSKDKDIKELVDDGIVVNFVSNGNLPGNALVRLKVTNEMKTIFGNSKIYIYYYDDLEKGFNKIANEVSAKNGYYEFTISHNSRYVLTKTTIDDKYVTEEEDNVVSFRSSNSHYLLWIAASIVLIVVIISIIVILKKRKQHAHR